MLKWFEIDACRDLKPEEIQYRRVAPLSSEQLTDGKLANTRNVNGAARRRAGQLEGLISRRLAREGRQLVGRVVRRRQRAEVRFTFRLVLPRQLPGVHLRGGRERPDVHAGGAVPHVVHDELLICVWGDVEREAAALHAVVQYPVLHDGRYLHAHQYLSYFNCSLTYVFLNPESSIANERRPKKRHPRLVGTREDPSRLRRRDLRLRVAQDGDRLVLRERRSNRIFAVQQVEVDERARRLDRKLCGRRDRQARAEDEDENEDRVRERAEEDDSYHPICEAVHDMLILC